MSLQPAPEYRAEFYRPDHPLLIIELREIARGVWRAVNPETGVPLHALTFGSAEEAGRLASEILAPTWRRLNGWSAPAAAAGPEVEP